ncbi:MAG TPA: PIG-L family deacetylase, partial [bacterium]|nr:PIG-L family deacetylase [bacterium]
CGGSPDIRKGEQSKVAEFLRAEEIIWGGQQDTSIPVSNEVIEVVDRAIKRTSADLVFFNHGGDTHQDHRALAKCCVSATRYIKTVLAYEVPTSINFTPHIFVDIGDVIEEKQKLLRIHESQVDKTRVPHLMITESAIACANFRGFQGKVKYAEGFMAIRYLLDW